ncbi:MAG: hypothetical protein HY717_23420 [Planctomycetes bacterium]|nr:hypothetical protein [Planctomycetota bacterium]
MIEERVEDTGIYKRTIRTANLKNTKDVEALLDEIADQELPQDDKFLADMDAAIRERLTKINQKYPQPPRPKVIESERRDAYRALLACERIRCGANTGYWWFNLGRLSERAAIRPFEPEAARGQKVVGGAKRGHEVVHGNKEDKLARWSELQKKIDEKMKNPGVSYHWACQQLAKECAASFSTLKRRTKNPKN